MAFQREPVTTATPVRRIIVPAFGSSYRVIKRLLHLYLQASPSRVYIVKRQFYILETGTVYGTEYHSRDHLQL